MQILNQNALPVQDDSLAHCDDGSGDHALSMIVNMFWQIINMRG
jgi:hypothetical protein